MGNSIYNMLGNNYSMPQLNNAMNILKQFNQFKSTFQGDPQRQVQELVNSGRMSQAQLNQYIQMAKQMQSMFK